MRLVDRLLWGPLRGLSERFGAPPEAKAHPVWNVIHADTEFQRLGAEGGVEPFEQNFGAFIRTVGLFPWVTACIRANCNTAAQVPIRVGVMRSTDNLETLDDHPLLDLLDRPHASVDGESRISLYCAIVQQLEFFGEAFLAIDGSSKDPELWLLKSERVNPISSPNPLRPIAGYAWTARNGQSVRLETENVIHIKYPNPFADDEFHGLSKLKELQTTLTLMFRAREWNSAYFQNAARPSGALEVPTELGDNAYRRLTESFKQARTGIKNAFRPMILEGGAKWASISSTPQDAEFIELWKLAREEILAVMGVPPVVVGLLEFANYANAREQRRAHFTGTIVPINQIVVDAINSSRVVRAYGEDVYLFHDYSTEDALQKDRAAEAAVDAIYLDRGVITPNEVRLREGLGKPLEGGDEPISAGPAPGFGLAPPPPSSEESPGPAEGPEDSEETEPDAGTEERAAELDDGLLVVRVEIAAETLDEFLDELERRGFGYTEILERDGIFTALQAPAPFAIGPAFRSNGLVFSRIARGAAYRAGLGDRDLPTIKAPNRRALQWRDIEKRRQPEERKWRRALRDLFARQEADVLEIVSRFEEASGPGPTHAKQLPPDLAAILISEASLADAWIMELIELAEETFARGARGAAFDIGRALSIDLDDVEVQALIRESIGSKIAGIATTQRETLAALVARAQAENLSTAALVGDIRELFTGMKRWKALQIARTETVALMNTGAIQELKSAGASTKIWVSARDADTRESHQAADGQEVPIEGDFSVGDGQGPSPGRIGIAAEDINCRCGTVVGSFEAAGVPAGG